MIEAKAGRISQGVNSILRNNVSERKISDERYAPMIVKSVVFGLITIILVGVVGKDTTTQKKADDRTPVKARISLDLENLI